MRLLISTLLLASACATTKPATQPALSHVVVVSTEPAAPMKMPATPEIEIWNPSDIDTPVPASTVETFGFGTADRDRR
jgi:methionine-rich copper-binding protein CopC